MGYKCKSTYHRTREEAEQAQARAKGADAGYSETYALGVFPCRLKDLQTGEIYDGWESKTETYYG